MGSSFRLRRVQYALDKAPIFNRVDSGQGELNDQEEIEVQVLETAPSGPQLQLWTGSARTDGWTTVGLSEDFEAHTHHVLAQFALLVRSEDFKEGLVSLMQKRKPEFQGR